MTAHSTEFSREGRGELENNRGKIQYSRGDQPGRRSFIHSETRINVVVNRELSRTRGV